jgi:ASC-1-like (ASCH) protein
MRKYIIIYVSKNSFELFENKQKNLEVRVAYPVFKKIKKGDVLTIKVLFADPGIERVVTRVTHYPALENLLEKEKITDINPDFATLSLSELKEILGANKKTEDIKKYGILAFKLKLLQE